MFASESSVSGKIDVLHIKRAKQARRRRLEIQRLKSIGEEFVNLNRRFCYSSTQRDEVSSSDSSCLTSSSSSSDSGSVPAPAPASASASADKNSREEEMRSPPYGTVSVCGRRRAMEDAVTVVKGLLSSKLFDFFAVYDGHGGDGVAHVCRDRLHRILELEMESKVVGVAEVEVNWVELMTCCFLKVDEEVHGRGEEVEDFKSIGSTAVVAVVGNDKVVVANCGDSRAVLSRAGVAMPLSCDHKPDRPDEMQRVEDAGGRVINWNGWRVLGVLATSRSIGDHYLKDYVISVPEVTVTDRTENDEFLILASDGLWDVMTNEVACEVVRRCFRGRMGRASPSSHNSATSSGGGGPGEAAAVLAELAMARGSKDNISVVVVELQKSNGSSG
ncbi:hypothetical protein GIB67_006409 [Kingdonia uniflora]|uniref:protein-serine/threonine phosphatase n=1 Tax=Kingdonia uniflora TaxID=39325 RepID=A0A7J7P147_9MAGN|nr:hypothetical protein GIB67_006409 [Kingdonia uniflora]